MKGAGVQGMSAIERMVVKRGEPCSALVQSPTVQIRVNRRVRYLKVSKKGQNISYPNAIGLYGEVLLMLVRVCDSTLWG